MLKQLILFDIVLSIYNQENLIERILYSIFRNTTTPFNLILVFDGCTDRTKPRALKYIKRYKAKNLKKLIVTDAPNVYETKANNIGFKLAKTDYMITLQDDMVINEYGWERRLTYPLRKFDDVLAVTSRTAQDIVGIEDGELIYRNQVSRESISLPRNIFAVRDVINRGPIAFNMNHLRKLDFLNENYAPSDLDDADLSLRAWEKYNLKVGAYWINYISPLYWGKGRAEDSTMYKNSHIARNSSKIIKTYGEYINRNIKHDENTLIPEKETDYLLSKHSIDNILYIFYRPYRIDKKSIKYTVIKINNFIKEIIFMILEKLGKNNVREIGIKKALHR